jgi:type VI secretion system protein ImpA
MNQNDFILSLEPIVEPWLSPISAEKPCGDNIEYDPEFSVLQTKLIPQSEVQYGNFTEKPSPIDWAEIEKECRRLLIKSKDIALLVWLIRARTRLGGAVGFVQGLAILTRVIQNFSEQIHPQIEIEGIIDPAVRANALASLTDPEGLLSDLRDLFISTHAATLLSVRDVERTNSVPRPAQAKEPAVVKRQLSAMYQQNDANLQALAYAHTLIQEIAQWSQDSLQLDSPNLKPIEKILSFFNPLGYTMEEKPVGIASSATNSDSPINTEASAYQQEMPNSLMVYPDENNTGMPYHTLSQTTQMSQLPQQRQQAKAFIQSARLWFEHNEPSSPVGILLKQAERLVGKRFSELAQAIPPDLLAQWDKDDPT